MIILKALGKGVAKVSVTSKGLKSTRVKLKIE
jgi:hypothetical protein